MEKRVVFVTGASSGIGRETVLLLAEKGFRVFAGVRKSADGAALAKAVGASLTPVILDVTRAASIRAAARAIEAALEPDESFSLVNNAGIAVAAPLELLSVDDLRRQFEVNVFGHVAVTQAFLPVLRSRQGRIVFMGSLFGRIAVPLVSPYSSAKFALEAIVDAFAVELHPWKIHVSILEPGNIATPIWQKFKSRGLDAHGKSARGRQSLYKDAEASMHRLADFFSRSGLTPRRVAKVVHRALSARHPRTRYLVGWDANLLARIVPLGTDRMRYWVIRRIIAPR